MEGLRPDIRAVVLVQRPPDLDTACSLALLQGEVDDGVFGATISTPELRPPDAPSRGGAPLPLPPQRPRVAQASVSTDCRDIDAARADTAKIKTLRDYRRDRGLCFKCGERWGHENVCLTSVQLHVVEELLELFSVDTIYNTEDTRE